MIDITALRNDLEFNPDTGIFRWRHGVASGNGAMRVKPGQEAGTNTTDGYRQIRWRGRIYRTHRLAWLYVYGEWPDGEIDHVNGNGRDNRLSNLRIASRSQNVANTRCRKTNKAGRKGVTWSPHAGRWSAWIGAGGKTKHLGYFETRDQAHEAYKDAAQRAYGEFARAA